MNHKRPWYEDWKTQCETAEKYVHAINPVPRAIHEKKIEHELDAFRDFTIFKVIFESNRLENVGLSESDTKKLILSERSFKEPHKIIQILGEISEVFEEKIFQNNFRPGVIVFEKKKRAALEVVRHYDAIFVALFYIYAAQIAALDEKVKSIRISIPLNGKLDSGGIQFDYRKIFPNLGRTPLEFFNEELIRHLNFTMAHQLMPKDAGIEAGFYRIDNRVTDFTIAFPSHENVPAAMKEFVARSNRILESKENPILKAARISYDFVAIHPFPDFNGRMSRLLMNMVLLREGLPFFAALRGSKTEKHKYITALRHANRGKIGSYAGLIARTVNDGFQQLNRNLESAGLKPIRPEAS